MSHMSNRDKGDIAHEHACKAYDGILKTRSSLDTNFKSDSMSEYRSAKLGSAGSSSSWSISFDDDEAFDMLTRRTKHKEESVALQHVYGRSWVCVPKDGDKKGVGARYNLISSIFDESNQCLRSSP